MSLGGEQQVRTGQDEVRLLHRRIGYTSRPVEAMDEGREPEAVSASYQQRLSDQARRKDRARQRLAWEAASSAIITALTECRASGRLDQRLVSGLRVVERATRRIDQEVARL